MVWWEAVLSPALQVLFDKFANGDIIESLRKWNVSHDLIEKLKIAYFRSAVVIDDAEAKQLQNPAVEAWLDMLKDAVYEAEDVLDELATEAQTAQLRSSKSVLHQVRKWNFVSGFNPFDEGIDSVVERVVDKLEYIASQKDVLGLNRDGSGGNCGVMRRVPTTSSLVSSHVHNRDHDAEEIMKLLMNDDKTSKVDISLLLIVGMGGIGKTTIAQYVFNDTTVDEHFNVKAWAYVSDSFDVVSITKAILESSTGRMWNTTNLEFLQGNLKKVLSKKKFLVVLDDVWNENLDSWNELLNPLMVGARGSRIVVTARNKGTNPVFSSLLSYQLKELSDDACWSIFLHFAFRQSDHEGHARLKAIGKEIVKKCRGLPLAAKCLGSLVGSNLDDHYWRSILNGNLWELPFNKCYILPALLLSYYHLPANLKQCFAYCAIFPKDYEFESKRLVLLWMAEGYVQQERESKTMEETGEEYFNELLSRSFFQRSPSCSSRYVMHDLVNDLAQLVSRGTCIRLEDQLGKRMNAKPSKRVHHFSFVRGKYDAYKKFEALEELRLLRTFIPLEPVSGIGFCYLTKKVPNDLLPKLISLRTLSLCGYCITELPDSIGNLKHLRYLDLSHTAIKHLSDSICCLYNLQTLLLNDCDSLEELPAELGDLVNLRYLDICGSGLQKMPLTMDRLKSLRSLPEFIVGADMRLKSLHSLPEFNVGADMSECARLSDLRSLRHLQGNLVISNLENVVDAWDARRACLVDKENIDELVMAWSANFDELRDERVETRVLEMLQPHEKLQKVAIRNYGGSKFPTWLGDPSFTRLVSIRCNDCRSCKFLPPLGQLPCLKKLYIKGLSGVKSVGAEFYGNMSFIKPFPSLETFHFEEMLELEDWSSCRGEEELEGFLSLHELYIRKCPKLVEKLPKHLPSLAVLVIQETEQLKSPLPLISTLSELDLKGCDRMVLIAASGLSSLVSLNICDIFNLTRLPGRLMQQLTHLQSLQVTDCSNLVCLWKNEVRPQHISSLRRLIIRNCPSLISMLEEGENLPVKLEYLEVEYCGSLERIAMSMHLLTCLGELIIKDCPRLISFVGTHFPSMLKGLTIRRCSFESLPGQMIHSFDAPLQCLSISGCYDFTSFSSNGDLSPTTFQQLTIDHCPSFDSLPSGILHSDNSFLSVLEIFDCSSLSSFPSGHLPTTLKTLTIWYCSNLESLESVRMHEKMSLESLRIGRCANLKSLPSNLHLLKYLDYLEVDQCPGLGLFPDGGFPTTSLKRVYISNCESLRSLPNHMQNLTSLQELRISDCPALDSLPEGGFPINLSLLEIKNCDNISPLSDWGLHRLTGLKELSLVGGCLEISSFPEWLLPPTLTSLHIAKLTNLQTLSDWLQNLTCLEDLKINECHKLLSLPEEGLPATLSRLEVSDCPLLEKQCEEDWNKIDHIPCILM